MIHLKSGQEIQIMQESGKRLREVMLELVPMVQAGVTTQAIDDEAERLILKNGGTPSFKTVKGYKWSTCVPINEQVVHTPPSERILKDKDILTIDIGLVYKGYHTDHAITLYVGDIETNQAMKRFFEVGKSALKKGIEKAINGNYLGEISQVIQNEVYGSGCFVLKDLTGHGIGKELHEDPYVFNYLERPVKKTYKIQPGLVIAIEVIYSMGTEEIAYEKKGEWSIKTKDDSLSACFEHTVAVTEENTYILT